MTYDLKLCPFCKGDGELVRDNLHMMRGYIVKCRSCGAETMYYKTKNNAVDAWNNRPIEDELGKFEAENEQLQKRLNESIDDNYKNALKIQQQAERGVNYARKENARLREALETVKTYAGLHTSLWEPNDPLDIIYETCVKVLGCED